MTNEERAFAYAPLAMPVAFITFSIVTGVSGFDMQLGLLNFLGLALAITVVGLPIVYIFGFFLGYRFYRLLLKKNRINIFTLSLGGVVLADIPIFLIWIFSGFGYQGHDLSTAFPLFSFVGFSIGLTFWYLLNWKPSSNKE